MTHFFLYMIRTVCTECGEPLILDGPVRSIACVACQSRVEIAPSHWKRIFDHRTQEAKLQHKVMPVVLGFASEFTFNTRMGRQAPTCAGCGEALDVSSLAPGMDGEIPCKCGRTMTTFPAPAWLREVEPKATQLLNAAREDGAGGAAAVTAAEVAGLRGRCRSAAPTAAPT